MAKKNDAAAFDECLLKELGRLPVEQKKLFLVQAKDSLQWISEAKQNQKWAPSSVHHAALKDLADKSRALILAMERTELCGVPEWYIREAWSIATNIHDAQGEPFPDRLPTTLRHLNLAARIWLPDPKPRHRPEEHSISVVAVRWLADRFHSAFCKPPTLGTGSPFVKFLNIALPHYGLSAPSLPKLKKILNR